MFLKSTTGKPAGILRSYGRGTVAVFGLPPTPEYGDWPLHGGCFVALNMELLRQTRGEIRETLHLPLGTETGVPLPEGTKPVRLYRAMLDARPEQLRSGKAPELSASGEVLPVLSLDALNVLSPAEPGAYRFKLFGAGQAEPFVQDVVFELPPEESDLAPLADEARGALERRGAGVCSSVDEALESLGGRMRVMRLTGPALALFLLLAALEAWINANLYKRGREDGVRSEPEGSTAQPPGEDVAETKPAVEEQR